MCLANLRLDPASPGLAGLNLDSRGRGRSKRSGKLKTIPTPLESSLFTGPPSPDTGTSERFLFPIESMLSAAGSRAKTFPLPAPEKVLGGGDPPCGEKCLDSFAKLDPSGCWLKMFRGYFQVMTDGSLEKFSGTWPRSGLMRNGTVSQREPSAPTTSATEYFCWPTPQASEGRFFHLSTKLAVNERGTTNISRKSGHRGTVRLTDYAWSRFKKPPNPEFAQWLMGFPKGWATNLDASATPSSRKSRKKSGG